MRYCVSWNSFISSQGSGWSNSVRFCSEPQHNTQPHVVIKVFVLHWLGSRLGIKLYTHNHHHHHVICCDYYYDGWTALWHNNDNHHSVVITTESLFATTSDHGISKTICTFRISFYNKKSICVVFRNLILRGNFFLWCVLSSIQKTKQNASLPILYILYNICIAHWYSHE